MPELAFARDVLTRYVIQASYLVANFTVALRKQPHHDVPPHRSYAIRRVVEEGLANLEFATAHFPDYAKDPFKQGNLAIMGRGRRLPTLKIRTQSRCRSLYRKIMLAPYCLASSAPDDEAASRFTACKELTLESVWIADVKTLHS